MKRAALLTLIVLVAGTQAANAGIKVLTPNQDSCVAFTTALDAASELNPILTGWAMGYFSGVAQGTGIDYLRNYDLTSLTLRLYDSCRSQPDKLLSLAAEELSRSLITEQGLMPTRQ